MKTSYPFIIRVFISFMVAFILTVLPLPTWLWWWRPIWVALVLMFWVLEFPASLSFGSAWVIGILYDVLSDSVLGEHAVALLMVVAIVRSSIHIVRSFNVFQQSFFILIVMFLYQILIMIIQGMLGQLNDVKWFWLPAVVSMLMWPWIYWLLSDYSQRLRSMA